MSSVSRFSIVMFTVMALGTACTSPRHSASTDDLDTRTGDLRARSLTIVDKQGRPRITMTVEDDGMGGDNVLLSILDSQGGLRGTLSLFHDTFPILQLNGARGEGNDDKERIVLSFDAGGDMPGTPSMSFYDHNDELKKRITLAPDDRAPSR